MKPSKQALNIVIVVALATAVDLLPGGGTAANFVLQVISLAFLAVIAWLATRLYREHRVAIYSLGTRRRTIAYVAIGVGALTLTATDRLWNTPAGSIAWIVLLGAAVYALFGVYRSSRQY